MCAAPTGTASPSASSDARHRATLLALHGRAGQLRSLHRCRAGPQRRHDPSSHLPVGAVPGLHRPPGLTGNRSREPPPAPVCQRARSAGGCPRRADERTEFHHRCRESRRPGGFLRQQQRHLGSVGGGGRLPGLVQAADDPGQHPPDIGVDDRCPGAEREGRDRPRGVLADAGQRQQLLDRIGHDAVMLDRDGGGRRMQPQRPPRVTQALPGPDGGGGGVPGQVGRCRPPGEPALIGRQHPHHRRLLEHHLADQDRPR